MWKKACLAAIGLAAVIALAGCSNGPASAGADTTLPSEGHATQTTAVPETTAAPETEPIPAVLTLDETYTIVRVETAGKLEVSAATALHKALGTRPNLTTDWSPKGEEPAFGACEILLGATNRPESAELGEGLGPNDYRVAVQGEKLVIAGGSDAAVVNAVAELIYSGVLAEGTIARDFTLSFDGADTREEYIANPDGFLCNWALKFDVPEWMTDWNEKLAAFADGDGRMMSSIHRSDFKQYPENSIEGIISAIKMGADNIELDVRLTKDNVVVLMHDETLKRTTDWEDKAGKNGLPTSEKLADWSFEELRQLRLTMNDGTKTDYLIPTFEEALIVCNGRITIRLDKYGVWNWDRDIQPLVEKTQAWQTCILNYHFSLNQQINIVKKIEAAGGTAPMVFYKFDHTKRADWPKLLQAMQKQNYLVIARWNGFSIKKPTTYVDQATNELAAIKDDIRFYIDAHLLGGGLETPEQWKYLYENGVDFLLVDDGLPLQIYIAENFEPTPY
ncbi:MAG: glycerophosphodiester phosphodiesterase family protein [Clostridia bacterium]|nr:glycerophosphodiester phosphodiesterase family protein [Clostridia bacterium]